MFKNKKQTAVKGKSPALVISVAIHVILFFAAGAFVAVEVMQRQEADFKGKQIVRPKMKLKKLHVPVKIEKKARQQAPKLSQRITAAQSIKTKSADFAMPEIGGFGAGGLGVDLSGASLGGSLGFASTQINVFGLKSSGEKIVFLLDAGSQMMSDKLGGIPAYKIIKDELISLLGSLPPTALFNVVLFNVSPQAFSPNMSQATDANIAKLKEWLDPLNSNPRGPYGTKTLGYQGTVVRFDPAAPVYIDQKGRWMTGLSYALQQGADNVYVLGTDAPNACMEIKTLAALKRGKDVDPNTRTDPTMGELIDEFGRERWEEMVAEANKLFDEENAQRLAEGLPIRVLSNNRHKIDVYLNNPAQPDWAREYESIYTYTASDIADYIEAAQRKYAAADRRAATIGLKKKKEFQLNLVQFVPEDGEDHGMQVMRDLARKMDGDSIQVRGLRAIKSRTGR